MTEGVATKSFSTDSMSALQALHYPDTGRNKVLLVDDCPNMRDFMRVILGRAFPDLEIIEANHPVEAIQMLSADGVADSLAFALSDKDMPWMTGVELAAIMNGQEINGKSLHPDHVTAMKGVPRLMMTGTYDPELAERLVADGLFHHVGEKGGAGGLMEVFGNIHTAILKAASLKTQEATV
ncbi:MAG: hypothetical protein NTZ25_02330 [Candidatus Peregrinibacteria bacterium]|nr:hypothetical protein [Candidatus Peregrinibacteria bacterium]